jgi:hypothetical protein
MNDNDFNSLVLIVSGAALAAMNQWWLIVIITVWLYLAGNKE